MKPKSLTYNIEKGLSFFNYNTGEIQSNIWEELRNGLWRLFSCEAYLYNDMLLSEDIEKSKQLFPTFHQIVPGTVWENNSNTLSKNLYVPTKTNGSLSNLLDATSLYIDSLNTKRIGVHLSGGFDSSLIMGLLKTLRIPFVPIGLKSETFEFRTERVIQDILMEWGEDGMLIDIEECPYYSGLMEIPAHQIPDSDIKSTNSAKILAAAFAERGCDVVFNGLGGDNLFVDAIKDINHMAFNVDYEFCNYTEAERYYKPYGIKLLSFYANHSIIDIISSARVGHGNDYHKLWARDWAKTILPKEIVEHSFFADFSGLTLWGLENAKPEIKVLMEEAYDFTNNAYFSPKKINRYLNQSYFAFDFKDYIRFCGLLSIASWYHSLLNND